MSLVMHVDAAAWRSHQDAVLAGDRLTVPVIKGNGYGFGLERLAGEAARLEADVVAVGTAGEVAAVRAGGFTGDVVVLTPWRPGDPIVEQMLDEAAQSGSGVIMTVSRVADAQALADSRPGLRVVLEVLTSMLRFGLAPQEFRHAVTACQDRLEIVGWTIHLPMTGEHLQEATDLATSAVAACRAPLWVSHLDDDELDVLRHRMPVTVRRRVGTHLWLGGADAYRYTSCVTDVHQVSRGERVGYWQRAVPDPRGGQVVVVDGGTSHGVAMSAPTPGASVRQQLTAAAGGLLNASRLALSPFSIGGRKRFFVEPPHMQASLVWVPGGVSVAVGDEIDVTMRATTATPDAIVLE